MAGDFQRMPKRGPDLWTLSNKEYNLHDQGVSEISTGYKRYSEVTELSLSVSD